MQKEAILKYKHVKYDFVDNTSEKKIVSTSPLTFLLKGKLIAIHERGFEIHSFKHLIITQKGEHYL